MAFATLWGAGCQTAQRGRGSGRPRGAAAVQALVGVAEYHKLEFERADPADPANRDSVDLSTMPAIGAAGSYSLGGTRVLDFGIDGSLLFSWDADRTSYASTSGNAVIVLDRRLFFADVGVGAYVSALLADTARIYAAAGPNLVFGDAVYRDELVTRGSSAFGYGGYVRSGIEFRLADRSFFGLGVRWVGSELDFGGPIGDVDMEGWQGFITYTIGF